VLRERERVAVEAFTRNAPGSFRHRYRHRGEERVHRALVAGAEDEARAGPSAS